MEPMKYRKIAAALIALTAVPTGARAQSSTAQAETLFRQGKDLMAHGRVAEACAAFDASQKLDPTIATLLNQASCREKNGQLATAWACSSTPSASRAQPATMPVASSTRSR